MAPEQIHRDIYRVLRVPERILSPIKRWTQNSQRMRLPTRMKSRSIQENAEVGLDSTPCIIIPRDTALSSSNTTLFGVNNSPIGWRAFPQINKS